MGINNMTREHFNQPRVLQLPIIFVINKIDICPENILNDTLKNLRKLVNSKGGGMKNLEIIENSDMNNDENNKILFYNQDSKKIFLNNDLNKLDNYSKLKKFKKS